LDLDQITKGMGKSWKLIVLPLLFWGLGLHAQQTNGKIGDARSQVRKVVEIFFEGFHKQDSSLILSTVAPGIALQTTSRDSQGKTRFSTEDFSKFVQSIVSIPDSIAYEERLTSFSIQVNQGLANAWVGYEFWVNGEFSHCGVNSFQMVNFDGHWKIVHLIDTRGKEDCPD